MENILNIIFYSKDLKKDTSIKQYLKEILIKFIKEGEGFDSKTPIEMNNMLNMATAFVNLSYRDACPKTVVQAMCCKMPILYANSGGVKEMVESYGIQIKDEELYNFEHIIPKIDLECLKIGYEYFKDNFNQLQQNLENRNNEKFFNIMLSHYFHHIKYAK